MAQEVSKADALNLAALKLPELHEGTSKRKLDNMDYRRDDLYVSFLPSLSLFQSLSSISRI
jgi:hypothetical protein